MRRTLSLCGRGKRIYNIDPENISAMGELHYGGNKEIRTNIWMKDQKNPTQFIRVRHSIAEIMKRCPGIKCRILPPLTEMDMVEWKVEHRTGREKRRSKKRLKKLRKQQKKRGPKVTFKPNKGIPLPEQKIEPPKFVPKIIVRKKQE